VTSGGDYAKYDQQISELRRNLQSLEDENDKLRGTMRTMVEDYTRQLELRDDNIRDLKDNLTGSASQATDHIQLR